MKRNVPKGGAGHFTAKLIGQLGLQTVCEEAKCPNRMECYSRKTATFMILGDVCTRGCRFCGVKKGKPLPPEVDEPRRVAEAVSRLGLKHVVITCVTRDDLPDGGAEHFARTIAEIRGGAVASGQWPVVSGQSLGGCVSDSEGWPLQRPLGTPTIEVLPSDFAGNAAAVDRLIEAAPEVYNHNTETVPRLFPTVRGKKVSELFFANSSTDVMLKHDLRGVFPSYRWTLEMFRRIHRAAPSIALKTGMMLGLGETTDELLDTWSDLLEAGCRMLTLGQYLQPSPAQMPVVRYVSPEEFERLGEMARRMGFEQVASGPFVRSSYRAREMLNAE
ncbi:MAG: lipoyl synthase [Planctomycetes bacterium]|nr:lipoyl synthase [Planctomycetota bacterium]MBU4400677.1 lipoyl synthase [Planctomycetota bacterium]